MGTNVVPGFNVHHARREACAVITTAVLLPKGRGSEDRSPSQVATIDEINRPGHVGRSFAGRSGNASSLLGGQGVLDRCTTYRQYLLAR